MKPVWSRRAVWDLEALRRHIAKDSEEIAAGVARRIRRLLTLYKLSRNWAARGEC